MDSQQNLDTSRGRTKRADWDLAKVLITQSRIKWALDTFKPYKSAKTDGTVPALLQHGTELLVPHLCHIYRACMAYGFIPMAWRHVKVIFIKNPGNLIIPRLRHIVLSDYRLLF
jgi:hypothetical protein